jgi:hypothetical protein
MLGASARQCEVKLAAISPGSVIPAEKERSVAEGKTLIQFIADDELMGKLEKLKGLLAHQNFEGRYDRLFEILADLALKKLDPGQRSEKKAKPDTEKAPNTPDPEFPFQTKSGEPVSTLEKSKTSRSRYIPASIKRSVWKRDAGQCTYRDLKTGRRCESRHALEYDHILPYAWSGETSESNLRLRCFAHNAYTAQKQGLSRR